MGSVSKAVTYRLPMNCHGDVSEDFVLKKCDHTCVLCAIPGCHIICFACGCRKHPLPTHVRPRVLILHTRFRSFVTLVGVFVGPHNLVALRRQFVDIEAGSDPRGHLGVTWGVYLCAGKPPLADIILSHPPDLTRCDSVIGLAIPAMSGHIQYRSATS